MFVRAGIVCVLLGGLACLVAIAARPDPVGRIRDAGAAAQSAAEGFGNPFWEHVQGDGGSVPCRHMIKDHPDGDPITTPCIHLTAQHPNGDPLPPAKCLHMVQQHPGGHDTGVKGPCKHPDQWGRPQHPDGDPVMAPCAHMVPQHPEGHAVPNAPCKHMVAQHPQGDDTGRKGPCVHIHAQHPNGDPGPRTPCVHPVRLVRTDDANRLKFYTDDQAIQREAVRAITWLRGQGIDLTRIGGPKSPRPRPLSIFTRPPVHENPDGTDPMWSHYEPLLHYVQVLNHLPGYDPVLTFRHELGHAMVGHKPVQMATMGGPHSYQQTQDPGLAMSEGWADFVRLVLTYRRDELHPKFAGYDWENAAAATDIPLTPNNEFRVGATLWDLYDTVNDGNDRVSFEFSELFRVYSPSLATLTEGPVIKDLDDYLSRLAKNHPEQKAAIEAVRVQNCGPRR